MGWRMIVGGQDWSESWFGGGGRNEAVMAWAVKATRTPMMVAGNSGMNFLQMDRNGKPAIPPTTTSTMKTINGWEDCLKSGLMVFVCYLVFFLGRMSMTYGW